MLTKNNVSDVTLFMNLVFTEISSSVRKGQIVHATNILVDLQPVVVAYLDGIKKYLPENGIQEFPRGNLLKQITWVVKHAPYLLSLFSAEDHLRYARGLAYTFARKYNLAFRPTVGQITK